jgi:hypothetical protein
MAHDCKIFADSDDEPEPENVEESSNGEEEEDPDPVPRLKRSGKASNKKAQLGTSLCLMSFVVAATIFFRQGKHGCEIKKDSGTTKRS